jgi:demethylmenaquinone methyltransferase/2-methoxy-6-polyprenyl-1,4-benzoquinol methylase
MNPPSIDAALKSYYAMRAPYYDAVYEKPERREDIAFLKQFLPERFAQRAVIEVACGTGYWTQHIAPATRAMTATDVLAEPLAFATARPGVEQVRFLEADAFALPVALGEFDGAFAGLWLSHVAMRRRAEFFASLHRLLQPGARVVLIDNSTVQCQELPIVERDADGNTYQHRPLRDGSVHRVLKNFPTQAELEAMIQGFGVRPAYRALANFWVLEYEAG